MAVEETVNDILNKVLDVQPEEIQKDKSLEDWHEVDSTEMVEITVGLKKALSLTIGDNEIKKTHTYNEIVDIFSKNIVWRYLFYWVFAKFSSDDFVQ